MTTNSVLPHRTEPETLREYAVWQGYTFIAIQCLLQACRGRHVVPKDLESYECELSSFMDFLVCIGATKLTDLDGRLISDFLLALSKKHGPGEVHAAYWAINALLGWLGWEALMPMECQGHVGIENEGGAL